MYWVSIDETIFQKITPGAKNLTLPSGEQITGVPNTEAERNAKRIFDMGTKVGTEMNSRYYDNVITRTLENGKVIETITNNLRSIEDIKLVKKAEVKTKRDLALYGGTTWNTNAIQTDEISIARVLGLRLGVVAGIHPVGGQGWRMMDNSVVVLSDTDATAMSDAVQTHVTACYDNQAAHEVAIEALTTQQEVVDYDVSTNWPANPEL